MCISTGSGGCSEEGRDGQRRLLEPRLDQKLELVQACPSVFVCQVGSLKRTCGVGMVLGPFQGSQIPTCAWKVQLEQWGSGSGELHARFLKKEWESGRVSGTFLMGPSNKPRR